MPSADFDPTAQPGLSYLADQIQRGQCILFLGAGVHAPPPDSLFDYPEEERPPLGAALAAKLDDAAKYRDAFPGDSCLDLQRVSLYLEIQSGRKRLVDSLIKHLRTGKTPSPALRMLAALPFRIIVTTNYDALLEEALRKADKDPVTLVYDPAGDKPTADIDEDPTPTRPLVFKMHGDLNERASIVITDEDYITFVQRMSDKDALHPIPQTIRFRMQKWPTLFVGYSLRDYNLRLLFRTLRWHVDPATFPIAYSVDQNPDPLILNVWQNKRSFVTFVTHDLWTFVPWLYETLEGRASTQ